MLRCCPRDPVGVLPVCSAPPVGTWWHSTSIPASFCLSRCAVESRRLRAVLPAGPAPLVGVRVGSPASQGRGPLPAAVAVAAVTEGHGQDRAPRQERLRSRAGLPGMARAVAQRGRPAPRPGSARFEGEGARLGEPALPAAPCAKVDLVPPSLGRGSVAPGAGLTLHSASSPWRPCSVSQPLRRCYGRLVPSLKLHLLKRARAVLVGRKRAGPDAAADLLVGSLVDFPLFTDT